MGLFALQPPTKKTPPVVWRSLKMGRRGFLKPGRMSEVLTLPIVFPALGHDVSIVYRTHPKDLLAQKVSSPPQR